ncbi:MAG: PAS domain S-box protein [Aquabacterium sp.]|uniref:PAS domain S-box protein n=1 Tax=Aquabacterium sp. TaxID=1872578 RepID=UPI001222CE32|nr:PAS domain S-box protein [Aquabacterium sp.]TAK93613.1 MAG: PAS domain S-box protein [Aquabacterium sp.]
MQVTRRALFSLRATVGYAVFAGAWILLSDRVLELFADPHALARFSTFKGLVFIAVTAAMLWVTLQNVPADTDINLTDDTPSQGGWLSVLWGIIPPLLAAALQWVFWAQIDPYAWLLDYPAVFVAAWLGGWYAGSLATALSAALSWYVFVPPAMSWHLAKPSHTVAIGVFVAMGLLMSMMIEWLRRLEHRASNRKFEALVEQTLAGIYIIEGDRFRYVNPAFATMLGYDDPDDIIHRLPVSALVAPPDRERVRQQLQTRFDDPSQEARYGFTGLRKDGTHVELEVHGRGLKTATGHAVIGLALNISERRRTEAALRQSEQLLRSVIEGTTEAIFVKDVAGRYLMVNQATSNMAGIPIEDILGKDDTELFDEASAKRIRAVDLAIMAAGTTQTAQEQLTFRNGHHHTFLVTKGPVKDDAGQLLGMFGLSRDITEMMSTQAALRDKQALLDRMSLLAKVGGWSLDVATMVGTRTDGAARILDLDPTQPASLRFNDGQRYFQGEHLDKITQTIRQAITEGTPYALELELISAKGVAKWIRTQGEPIMVDGRVARIEGAIQDISEVRQARVALQAHQEHLEQMVRARTAELETARQEAEQLARIKSDFLANMSHEIRTPLNGVLGLAQIGAREHTGEARQIFDQINASGRLLLGVINDILDFSKIEAGKLRIDLQPVQIREVLARAMALVQERAREKGLPLLIDVDDSVPASCVGDALRLEQIVLNLLSNAVKFTAQGEVRVHAHARDGHLLIDVIDTGIGMTPTQIEGLFRPFEQADGSTTRQYGGTGLGLTISKRLVEMLDGQIRAFSEPGQGTRFEVSLPLITTQPSPLQTSTLGPTTAPSQEQTQAATYAGGRLAGIRVLAAEDNLVNQMVLSELLSYEGAQVVMSDSGLAVLAQLQDKGAQAFDVVLMDIQMPQMDGYDATRQVKRLAPNLPVIGQTAHAMSEEHAKCLEAGMVDLVVKPIELETLVRTILRHVPTNIPVC